MHEFIIHILVLVLATYLAFPLDKLFSKAYSKEARTFLATVVGILAFLSLAKQDELISLIVVMPIFILIVRLFNNYRAFQFTIIALVVLIVLTNCINLVSFANYLGVILFIMVGGLVLKGFVINDK